MAIGFKVKYYWYQIGASDFLHSFFSTVCFYLENGNWGSKYPHIMKSLYGGELTYEDVGKALNELVEIKTKLQNYSPEKVIWDIEDLSAKPPWKDNISIHITNLSNYFITSDGADFLTMLETALEKAKSLKTSLRIETI